MGASTTAAFTDYVTHLIAEEHGGAKYWVGDISTLTYLILN
jgi:twin BRCT domain